MEIGPGLGTLTKALAEKAKKVIAIEKDAVFIEILKKTLSNFMNVDIINGNILKMNFQLSIINFQSNSNIQLPKNYKLVANLPYYITSPVIRKFLEMENSPTSMVFMIQKEVAQRICAKPPNMSLLAVSVQYYAKPEIISYVSKKCFWPSPNVDSAIIKIVPRNYAEINPAKSPESDSGASAKPPQKKDIDLFFKVAKAGFSHPRKQLLNNLSVSLKMNKEKINLWLLTNNIRPSQRAETLTIENWTSLANSFPV